MVTKLDIKRYGGWYRRAHERLKREYGEDADLFADLLAATSPRMSVKRNWRAAWALYSRWVSSGTIDVDLVPMRSHLPNVIRAFERQPLSGPKVQRFAANLKGDFNVVTIDVWMCEYYGVTHKKLTPRLYKKLERRVQDCARKHGCYPCEYQAAAWVITRLNHGRKPSSFLSVAEDDKQMKWEWAK
jgi:hypothetical protein